MRVMCLFFVIVAAVFGDANDVGFDSIAFQLRSAGIDPNSDAALIRTMQNHPPPSYLAGAAAFELGYLPATPHGISVLRSALNSQDEGLVANAARSLNRLGVHDWTPLLRARIATFGQPALKFGVVAYMADAGDFSAWPLVRAAIADPNLPDGMMQEISLFLPSFYAMPGREGPRLTLEERRLGATGTTRPFAPRRALFSGSREQCTQW